MPDRLEVADVTVAASVLSTAPTEISLNFPVGVVRKITIVIPAGHDGLTGIALGYGHTPVWPRQQPSFLSGDDEVFAFAYVDKVPGVPWSAFVCNNDSMSHSFEVRMEFDELNVTVASSRPPMLSTDQINSAAAAVLSEA